MKTAAKKPSALPPEAFDSLVQMFREWHAFDESRSPAKTRAALAAVEKAMQAAATCIIESTEGGADVADETPMKAAWRLVNIVAQESGIRSARPAQRWQDVSAALTDWAIFARRAADRVPATRAAQTAVRMAADRLCELRAHYQLPVAGTDGGDTVAELLRAAKAAGCGLTEPAALKRVKEAVARRKKIGTNSK